MQQNFEQYVKTGDWKELIFVFLKLTTEVCLCKSIFPTRHSSGLFMFLDISAFVSSGDTLSFW